MRNVRPRMTRNLLLAFGLSLALGAFSCAKAEEGSISDVLGLKGRTGARQSPADWEATLVPEGRAGEIVLRLTATIPPEHYIYSTTKNNGVETKITINEAQGLEDVGTGFEADHPPELVEDPNLNFEVEKYFRKVTWTKRYRLRAGVAANTASVTGIVNYQVCDKQNCRRGKYTIDVRLAGSAGALPKPSAMEDPSTRFEQLVGPKESKTVEGVWTVSVAPRQAQPGAQVTITVQAKLNPGWHVYALDQRQLPEDGGPTPTVIGLTETGGLIPTEPSFTGPQPAEKASEEWKGLQERFHEGQIVWSRKFRIPENAAGALELAGKVAWAMCNSGGCQPPTGFEFRGSFAVADDVLPDALPLALSPLRRGEVASTIEELRLNAEDDPNVVRNEPGAGSKVEHNDVAAVPASPEGQIDKSQGLAFFLTAAVLAGFAALLTPCVFPMIPITVSFFQKQSEKEHHRPISMATVYCLGIIGTFTGLGMLMSILFSATAIQQLASHWTVNLFIAGVLVFFAFNLLGMFEIQMPSWLLTYTAGQEGRGGFIGVLFMALTFTLTSFTCTFAFAGGLLAAAAHGDRLWPTLGLLAFSAAFSLPFFFLALFPSLLQKLPKSGGWMNVAKVVMGLIELGAAFKFFGNVDTTWNGQPAIFDFHLMISAWAVISIAAAMYLLGLFRLPHDVASNHIGVGRFVLAMSFLGFASYLSVGLFAADKPHGMVWRYVEAFANPNFETGSGRMGPSLKHGGLEYSLDFEKAFEAAIAENKPVFLDFTGVTCTNCRYMEKGPMSKPDIEERLGRFVRIQLFTDAVPIPDKKEAGRLLDLNVRLQEDWFGDVTLPSYVVIPPDRAVLKDPSKILDTLKGKREDEEFAQFLDRGWAGWQKFQANGATRVVGQR